MEFKKKPKVKRVVAKRIEKPKSQSSSKSNSLMMANQPAIQAKSLSEKADLAEKVVVEHTKEHLVKRFDNLRGVRKMVFMWLFLVTILLLAVGFSQFLNKQKYTQNVFGDGGTYSEGIVGEVNTLNPIFASTEAERSFSRIAFAQLVNNDTSGKPKSELATSIKPSDDFKNYTIKLNKNSRWSDDTKLTSKDVEFTIEMMQNKIINPSQYMVWSGVKTSVPDEETINIHLSNPARNFIYSLNFPILPEHKLKDVSPEKMRENSFSENPITSGPFKLRSFQKTEGRKSIFMDANPNYFMGKPKLDRFEIRAYTEHNRLKDALLSGEVASSPSLSLADFDDAQKVRFTEKVNSLNGGIFAFMNENDPILKDQKVRQAIQSGIDINEIRKQISNTESLDAPILPEFLSGVSFDKPKLDIENSKKLLEEAGWKAGKNGIRQKDGKPLLVNVTSIKNSKMEKITQLFANNLRSLGFEVDARIVDPEDKTQSFIQTTLQPRTYGVLIYEITLGSDPDIYAFWHSSQASELGFNLSNYKDAVSDDILSSARNLDDNKLRRAKFESFIKRWMKNVPAIGLVRSQSHYIYKNSVKPFSEDNKFVDKVDRYADVIYWQANKQDVYKTP